MAAALAIAILAYLAQPHSAQSQAIDRKLTAITVLGVPPKERPFYFPVLRQFAVNSIQAFLARLGLDDEKINTEFNLKVLPDNDCLSQTTVLDISESLRRGCGPDAEHQFISSIMLPRFSDDGTSIEISFFPYSLARLKELKRPYDYSIDYVEPYRDLIRDKTEALIVLGFLNRYWDKIKDKKALTETEQKIAYSGFGPHAWKVSQLCRALKGLSQARCITVSEEAKQIPEIARRRPTGSSIRP